MTSEVHESLTARPIATRVRTIRTRVNGGWVVVKVETDQPGLYGIGSASDWYQGDTVVAAIEHSLRPWDIAALLPIVAEAGGRTTAVDGWPPLVGPGLVTTNGVLHDAVLAAL